MEIIDTYGERKNTNTLFPTQAHGSSPLRLRSETFCNAARRTRGSKDACSRQRNELHHCCADSGSNGRALGVKKRTFVTTSSARILADIKRQVEPTSRHALPSWMRTTPARLIRRSSCCKRLALVQSACRHRRPWALRTAWLVYTCARYTRQTSRPSQVAAVDDARPILRGPICSFLTSHSLALLALEGNTCADYKFVPRYDLYVVAYLCGLEYTRDLAR